MAEEMQFISKTANNGATGADQTKKEVIDILWKFKTGNIQYVDYGKLLELIKIPGMEAYAKNIAKAYAEQLFKEFNHCKEKLPEDIKKQYEDIKTTYGKIIKDNPIDALVLIYTALNYNKTGKEFKEKFTAILSDSKKPPKPEQDVVKTNPQPQETASAPQSTSGRSNSSNPTRIFFKPDQPHGYVGETPAKGSKEYFALLNERLNPNNMGRWMPNNNVSRENKEISDEKERATSEIYDDKRPVYEFIVSSNALEQGVRNMSSVYQFVSGIKDKALENTPFEQTVLGRGLKWLSLDFPFAGSLHYMNHEYSGHEVINEKYGGKAVVKIDSYGIPFGVSGHWETKKEWDLSFNEYCATNKGIDFVASGMWADKRMASYQLENMHLKGKADHASNLAFLASKIAPSKYVLQGSYRPDDPEFNRHNLDPDGYIVILHNKFVCDPKRFHYIPYPKGPDGPVGIYEFKAPTMEGIRKGLEDGAWLQILSPAHLIAWGNEFNYLATGQTEFKMPGRFFDTYFLPGQDGIIYGLDYYTQTAKKKYPLVVSAWDCPMGNYGNGNYGLKAKTWYMDGSGKPVGWVEFDLWQQEGKIGGAAEFEWRKAIIRRNIAVDIVFGLGVKTDGFKLGYPDKASVNWTAGLNARF